MTLDRGISVIVCTWNRADSLAVTLESLYKQEQVDYAYYEVIVVDNNSTDNSKDVIAKSALDWKLGELCYVFESHQGKQYALNRGIKAAKYNILAFTDDDIILPPDWISTIVEIFNDEKIDLCGGKTITLWPESGKPIWYDDSMSAVVGAIDLGDEVKINPFPEYAPAGANLIARRRTFDRFGMFSEEHYRHMDQEYGGRCIREGAVVCYHPKLIVYAPVNPSCLSKKYFRRWAYKAGIPLGVDEDKSSMLFLGMPRWVIRRFFSDCLLVATGLFVGSPREAFKREVRLWKSLGMLQGYVRLRFLRNTYMRWVEMRSQKKNDRY